MRLTVFVVLGMTISLAGCQSGNSDRDHITGAWAWRNARVTEKQIWSGATAKDVSVSPGDGVVLMSNDGYSRVKNSTAHASHWAFYIQLPAQLAEGKAYHVSQREGTLSLSAFEGYNAWYLDPNQLAEATVTVRAIRRDAIVADLDIKGTATCDDERRPEQQRARRPITRVGTFEFEHHRLSEE